MYDKEYFVLGSYSKLNGYYFSDKIGWDGTENPVLNEDTQNG